MKIGILTYHYVSNFGANLQTLATIWCLRNRGHEPVVLDWRPEDVESRYRRHTPAEQVAVHLDMLRLFPLTAMCRTPKQIAQVAEAEALDGLIIGSDAVVGIMPRKAQRGFSFRELKFVDIQPESVNEVPNPYWGSFLQWIGRSVPCAMMSVSSQQTRYQLLSEAERGSLSTCLKRFQYVSVRDAWTSRMMQWISDGAVVPDITPDPVFAFNDNVPAALTDRSLLKRFCLPDRYILISFKATHSVPTTWVTRFAQAARQRGIECVALPYPQELNAFGLAHRINLPLSPLEWYALIKHSAAYVGHNMHPIICCIHNGVPFYSFDNYGCLRWRLLVDRTSSKIHDLLSQLDLLGNWHSVVGPARRCPAPEVVLDRVTSFDSAKCHAAGTLMRNRHTELMLRLEDAIRH